MRDFKDSYFLGVVSSSDAGTYTIQVDALGAPEQVSFLQGIPLVGVFASTIGFRECPQYPVGVMVLCYYLTGDKCYIMGIIPEHDAGNLKFFSRACLKTADGKFDIQNIQGYAQDSTKMVTHNQNRPTDVVEGEHVIANEFGVLLGLFQQMATLKGSELAQIQCYVLDDFVRLISHNFQHLTAMGELNVWHDGKSIMAELGATHLSGESIGVPQVEAVSNKPVFTDKSDGSTLPSSDDKSDYYEFLNSDKQRAIERLKIFVGRLGDFIHIFLSRPDEDAIRSLAGAVTGNFDRGLFDVHVSIDGRLSVRSITGIAIEKTNWIMVPERVRKPEDPMGDDGETIDFPEKDPFKFDNKALYRNNPTLYYLQLRDCLAYLQDFYSYKNFLAYKDDFKMSQSPLNNETNFEEINKVDPNTPVNYKDYKLRRSGMYFMDNGGILIKEAMGAAIVLEGGDINIQPAKDLILQPLRHLVAKVGQHTSISSKKDITLSSTEESFYLKTRGVQHLYSSQQGIILQSDAVSDSAPSPESEAYTDFGGILFKAGSAGIYSYGERVFDRATDQILYKSDSQFTIQSKDDLILRSTRDLYLIPDQNLFAIAQQDLYAIASSQVLVGAPTTLIGQEGSPVNLVPAPGSFPVQLNGVLDTGQLTSIADDIKSVDPQQEMFPFNADSEFTKVEFRFLSSDKYNLQDIGADHIPMTIAQQDDAAFQFLSLTVWKEEEIQGTLPFPGKDKFDEYYVTAELKNLQVVQNDIYSKDITTLSNEGSELNYTSLMQYKILE